MQFLVLKETEEKCRNALFVKKCDFFDSKSMLTSLIAQGLGQGIHFRGQKRHWSILTGTLVINHYIFGHLSTFFTCCMSIYR